MSSLALENFQIGAQSSDLHDVKVRGIAAPQESHPLLMMHA